jgi:hypothetical protein
MNPIQPIVTPPPEISVAAPISPALDRVKRLLFQPFDLGKWFVIGFCAWLAGLGERGGGFNFHSPGGGGHGGGGTYRREFDEARHYVLENLYWIVPLVMAVAVLGFGLWMLFRWLNSRGRFMFLHCVALDKAEVAVPWQKFAHEGNSLFLFRLGFGLIGMALMLPFAVVAGLMIFRMSFGGQWNIRGIMGLVGLGLLLILIGIVFAIISKFTKDFVVPIMFLRGKRCLEAWRELLGLLSDNLGQFILYLLFQIVLSAAIGMLVLAVMIATCCCCCLMLLPYIGTVLLLPVLVFQRAYSLYYLAQYGRAYDVFALPTTPGTNPAPGRV